MQWNTVAAIVSLMCLSRMAKGHILASDVAIFLAAALILVGLPTKEKKP